MNKRKIKKAIKQIFTLSDEMQQGMYMDNAMDGSGECGHIIFKSWCNWFSKKVDEVLIENDVTIKDILITADIWAKTELEMRPKKDIFIRYTRRQGHFKPLDYLDTKYGQINFILGSAINEKI